MAVMRDKKLVIVKVDNSASQWVAWRDTLWAVQTAGLLERLMAVSKGE